MVVDCNTGFSPIENAFCIYPKIRDLLRLLLNLREALEAAR